jgi:hypothetical protein
VLRAPEGQGGATVFQPLSTGITFALTEKAPNDKIPLITSGYGRADSVDGMAFKWNFPLLGTYWTGASVLVQHVKKTAGLKGKKVALPSITTAPTARSRSRCSRSWASRKASS